MSLHLKNLTSFFGFLQSQWIIERQSQTRMNQNLVSKFSHKKFSIQDKRTQWLSQKKRAKTIEDNIKNQLTRLNFDKELKRFQRLMQGLFQNSNFTQSQHGSLKEQIDQILQDINSTEEKILQKNEIMASSSNHPLDVILQEIENQFGHQQTSFLEQGTQRHLLQNQIDSQIQNLNQVLDKLKKHKIFGKIFSFVQAALEPMLRAGAIYLTTLLPPMSFFLQSFISQFAQKIGNIFLNFSAYGIDKPLRKNIQERQKKNDLFSQFRHQLQKWQLFSNQHTQKIQSVLQKSLQNLKRKIN